MKINTKLLEKLFMPDETIKTPNVPELTVNILNKNTLGVSKKETPGVRTKIITANGREIFNFFNENPEFNVVKFSGGDLFIPMYFASEVDFTGKYVVNSDNKIEIRGAAEDTNKVFGTNYKYIGMGFKCREFVLGETYCKFNIECEQLDVIPIHSHASTLNWYVQVFNTTNVQCNTIRFVRSGMAKTLLRIIDNIKTKDDFIKMFNIKDNIKFEHFIIGNKQIF